MDCYIVSYSLGDLTVAMDSDRSRNWAIEVQGPNPVRGRGRPRVVRTKVDVYRAALRHDETTDAFFEDLPLRSEKNAAWLEENLDVLVRTYHDANVWNEVKELQRARAKRLFGPGKKQR